MNREETLNYINNHGILPESKFGQNFLCDEQIIEDIVELTNAEEGDKILEIGPGIGALTHVLADKGVNVTAVEIDKRLAQYLTEDGFNIITADYIKLKDYNADSYEYAVSNIPYYVMTPIMIKLITDLRNCKKFTFMVEDDAIDRINAQPSTKQYGPLAVLCSCYGTFCREFTVPSSSFVPPPHTVSAVITLTKSNTGFIIDKGFTDFVTRSFMNRRKKMTNTVPEAKEALIQLGIDPSIRSEALTPAQFMDIYAIIRQTL